MINEGIRWGRKFGYGTFLGNKGEKYFQEDIEKRVRKMAWSHACPVVEKVVKEYGPEWTEKRYAECNLFFGLITDEAAGCNFPLYFNLLQPVDRLPEETADPNINKKNVPLTFWRQMSPLSTPWGYALPRVLIEQFGRGENNKDRTAERITKGLQILEDEVRIDSDPIDLLINLSEKVVKMDADSEEVVAHILAKGILIEEGCKTMYREITQKIEERAPTLWASYQKMLVDEKWLGQIIRPEDLK